MQQGDFPQAKAQLEQVVALQPENGDAWSILGLCRQASRRLRQG